MKTTIRSHAVRSLLHPEAPRPARPRDLLDPLIRRAAVGERSAIAALARSYRPLLVATARRHLDDKWNAEDVVQDVFVLLLEGTLRPPGTAQSAVGWLLHAVFTVAEEHNGVRP